MKAKLALKCDRQELIDCEIQGGIVCDREGFIDLHPSSLPSLIFDHVHRVVALDQSEDTCLLHGDLTLLQEKTQSGGGRRDDKVRQEDVLKLT